MKKYFWIVNAILAVIAAIMAIMQEVWLGTPLYFWNAFAVGSCIAICLSACGEWVKILPKFIPYWDWHWKDVIIGSVFGIIAALVTALLVV